MTTIDLQFYETKFRFITGLPVWQTSRKMGVISPFFPVSGKFTPVFPPWMYLCLISGGSGNG